MNNQRLYSDLAWIWPLWEPVDDYRDETTFIIAEAEHLMQQRIGTILDLGCGGGKHAFHFARHAAVTGVDLSASMLTLARELNPGSDFCIGDIRSVRLGTTFDMVFLNDAASYMLSEDELRQLFATAKAHLAQGGVMAVIPDHFTETFENGETTVHRCGQENSPIVIIENVFDTNPDDTICEATFVYLIRQNGELTIETDRHEWGLFPKTVWLRLLEEAGFEVLERVYNTKTAEGEEWSLPAFFCS